MMLPLQDKARSLKSQMALETKINLLLNENREKGERLDYIEGLLATQRSIERNIFRQRHLGMSPNEQTVCKTTLWNNEESCHPPILVAASLDDDTASETESRADGLES